MMPALATTETASLTTTTLIAKALQEANRTQIKANASPRKTVLKCF